MSAVVAQSLHVFGLRSHVANNIFYFDEQIIIFPSGNYCVKYNVDQKWQKFIPGMVCATCNPIIPTPRMSAGAPDSHQALPQLTPPEKETSQLFWTSPSLHLAVEKGIIGWFLAHAVTASFLLPSRMHLLEIVSVYRVCCFFVSSLIEFPPVSSPLPSYEQMVAASSHSQMSMPQVFAIAAYSKGFACSAGPGRVLLFEKMEEKDVYRESREIRLPVDPQSNDPSQSDKQDILCLCFSPSEETLVASTSKNQLYSITMSLTEISKGEAAHFEYLMYPLHSASITGLATCIRKPLIATCSLDRSVRIWNYETNTLELYKEYQEEAYSISLHPSGHFVVVGFADKLRLMNLLIDDIRSFKEYSVRGSRECSFSNGGHLFAAVNGNVIHIYTTTNLENILSLKGHTGKIRSVVWNADDSKLISGGTDGAVYEWNLSTGKRETECVLKSCSYHCVTISPDAKIIFAVGTDYTLKEIADSSILREIPAFDVIYTAIAISHSGRMMFVGTSVGTIRAMRYPLPLQKEFNEYQAHAGPVTKMLLTFDDQFLLTTAEDGCLFTWKVFDKDGRGIKREREVGFAEEVLVTKTDMEEKAQVMLELKTRVEELKMENEYQLRLKDMNYSEKIKELTDKFLQEMESLKTKNQVLRTEKEKQDVSHHEHIEELLDKQSRELQDLESCNNQKLLLEYEKYQELQLKSQRMQEEYEKQLRDNDETKSQALEELTEFYEAKLQEKTTLLEEVLTGSHAVPPFHRERNLYLMGETFSSLQKEIEERTNDIETLKGEQVKLQGVIKSLEKDIQGFKREIQERDETIQDKEKRIYDLKKKNQELGKFKFVLDYKIKELKKQIEPRENEIRVMKEQIQEMEAELEHFHKQNTQLELNITELWQKLRATDQEMRRERQKERDLEALVKRFKTDLHNCVAYIQEPRLLKEKVRGLFEKYVQRADMVEIAGLNTDLQQEYSRQREHLERNLATLKKKVVKEGELHRADYVRIMQENVSLITEINELRRELKFTRSQVYDLEAALKLTKKVRPQEVSETEPSKDMPSTAPTMRLNEQEETGRIIEMQRLEIQRLRDQIQEQEQVTGFHALTGVRLPSLSNSEADFEVKTN
uniref:Cilia and flagella associated protein 57 n=1 Tax=Saimiri boliviensis boliviensis TaxID=39432 RepID=A0A2K6S6K0_SAIBB